MMLLVYLAVLVFIGCIVYSIIKGLIGMFGKLFKKKEEKEVIDFDKLNWDIFLKNEAKFQYQNHKVKRASLEDKITLGYILENVLDVDKKDISKMCIVLKDRSREIKTSIIEETETIWNYDLFSAFILQHEDGSWGFRFGQDMVSVVVYLHLVTGEEWCCISLRELIRAGSTWYAIIYIFSHFNMETQFFKNVPQYIILAFDTESQEEKLQKFEQIRLSAEKKIKNKEKLNKDEAALLKGYSYFKMRSLIQQNNY